MKLKTPIGEFTTDSYKIPAEDTLAVSPAIISFSSDDYKIITIDQFIQLVQMSIPLFYIKIVCLLIKNHLPTDYRTA